MAFRIMQPWLMGRQLIFYRITTTTIQGSKFRKVYLFTSLDFVSILDQINDLTTIIIVSLGQNTKHISVTNESFVIYSKIRAKPSRNVNKIPSFIDKHVHNRIQYRNVAWSFWIWRQIYSTCSMAIFQSEIPDW